MARYSYLDRHRTLMPLAQEPRVRSELIDSLAVIWVLICTECMSRIKCVH